MNSRSFIILSVIILAVVGAALWVLQSTPPTPALPELATATPDSTATAADLPPSPSSREKTTAAEPAVAPPASVPRPAAPMAEWEVKIDAILRANPDNSDAANSSTAQMLINLLPTLPPEGQSEAAQHVSNLLADKDYSKVLPIIKNPTMTEDVLDVLVTDLMNRDDAVKLPTLLEIAKIPNHPHREEAATDLQIFLDEDYGTDWAKWDSAMKAYLKKQAAENADSPTPAPAK